jgi:HD-GYP domain-containing protein (c-di-GMP phosphodiesterase class II)/ABC-type amino acid transport substrate-binding protein
MHDVFAEVMRNNPIFFSIYIGFPNGDFYEVVNLENSNDVRKGVYALPQDRWAVNRITTEDGARIRRIYYYNDDFVLRDVFTESSNYDARTRHWFIAARQNQVTKSPPYMFRYPQVPGQTFSMRLPETDAVLGIDITLQSFADFLKRQPLSSAGEMYVYRKTGEILASNRAIVMDEALPAITPLTLTGTQRAYLDSLGTIRVSNEMDWPPIDFSVAGQPRGYTVDKLRMIGQMIGVNIEFINGYTWPELVQKFNAGEIDILQPVLATSPISRLGATSDAIIDLPYALVLNAKTPPLTNLSELAGKTLALPGGWSLIDLVRTTYPEINILTVASTKAALEAVRDGKAFATLDAAVILRYTAQQYFIEGLQFIGQPIESAEPLPSDFVLVFGAGFEPLYEIIGEALAALSEEQIVALEQKWLADMERVQSESLASAPYAELMRTLDSPELLGKLQAVKLRGQQHFAFVSPLTFSADQADYFAMVIPAEKVLSESLRRVRWSIVLTVICLLLLLPVSWLFAEPIVRPIATLFDKTESVRERRYGDVRYYPSSIKEIDALSRSMVVMSTSIQKHELEQRELMEAFIQLIASAIDEKSPYTGGHCERVPELALMLARAAAESDTPALRDFSFNSDDEYREFRIAAWLHDCGKIIVPEHIVDKGSKLETIYNRIHEIRMRFEVLWRDAEITYLQSRATEPEKSELFAQQLQQTRERLQEDFTFVASTNIGGEFLSEADQQRLCSIAQLTWQRHFDDRAGLSPVDELRLKGEPEPLPATEFLLANKPEHLIARHRDVHYDPALGIKVEVPKHLYNLGEIYNLSISRGTLTAEDRFKINEHIINTITMLESLPFPRELARVPRYASTHHETMKGTGYPRKLTRDDLSIPERILVLADIYEALTAADRPYKKAKTVSAAIDILYNMVEDDHVDRDIFEFFLSSGIYRDYAERYLAPEQIDAVDIARYVSHLA